MFEIFKGIKVIELASVLAGPMVGTFFAELGAEVIKIENKRSSGDPTRQWYAASERTDRVSAYYASANYKKKSLMLDLTQEQDYKLLIQEIRDADIVVNNFPDSVSRKLKVQYEFLSQLKNDLIYCQLYAYDKEDPRPGYDMVMQAECGFLSMSGVDKSYAKIPVALIDVLASHQMKEGILIALIRKSNGYEAPQLIEVSLYQSAIASLANQASNYLMNGTIPERMGTAHPNIAPYGDLYFTSDNQPIILTIGSDKQFLKLVETLNQSLNVFSKFMLNKNRVQDREGLNELLQSRIGELTSSVLSELFRRKQIPHCFILNLKQVFGHPLAESMVRSEMIEGHVVHGVKTISFEIY
ncbi:MAG: CoA transferase [Saprospiraceae bacterium]|nr:CoA transferase [Saprospiraceae bacterium]